jgi:hypothetical protein
VIPYELAHSDSAIKAIKMCRHVRILSERGHNREHSVRIPGEDYGQAAVGVGELIVDRQACIKDTNCQPGVGSTEQAGLRNMRWRDEAMVPGTSQPSCMEEP